MKVDAPPAVALLALFDASSAAYGARMPYTPREGATAPVSGSKHQPAFREVLPGDDPARKS